MPYQPKAFGFKRPQDIIGKSDFDTPAAKFADNFIANDKLAMTTNTHYFVEISQTYDQKQFAFLVQKQPIFDKSDKIVGTYCYCFPNPNPLVICSDFSNNLSNKPHLSHYHFNHKGVFIKLTKRESYCFYYLMRHNTIAKIAMMLHRSARTIAMHIENIKQKTRLL